MLAAVNPEKTPPERTDAELQQHWNHAYLQKGAHQVSWFSQHLECSLALLKSAGLTARSRLIDVGGGASHLVDDLLALGLDDILILDLSEHALALARTRLGDTGERVHWQVADVRTAKLDGGQYDFWHDRAVLHFLHAPEDLHDYAAQVRLALRPGGHAVIGGFGTDGPERCSGLPVARRSAEDIARTLGSEFELLDQRREQHLTPAGASQSFVYALLRRR